MADNVLLSPGVQLNDLMSVFLTRCPPGQSSPAAACHPAESLRHYRLRPLRRRLLPRGSFCTCGFATLRPLRPLRPSRPVPPAANSLSLYLSLLLFCFLTLLISEIVQHLSSSDLFHVAQYPPGPTMLSQMARVCPFPWRSDIPLCACTYILSRDRTVWRQEEPRSGRNGSAQLEHREVVP